MATPAAVPVFRFGVFELDVRSGELRKSGVKIKIQDQPLQVLCLLLERPGEVVTREQLRARLWPGDTFVDFDIALNVAVKKVRDALGDSAERPRFVETVPRKGYRLVVPVDSGVAKDTIAQTAASSRGRNLRTGAIAAGLLAVVLAMGFYAARHGKRPPLQPAIRSLAVLPLQNLSRDPDQEYFASGMTDAIITNLAQIRSLRVISRTSVMHFQGTQLSAPRIARELSVDAIVEGSVMRDGDRIRITAQLIDGATDRHLWAQTYEVEMRDVIGLQRRVARDIAANVQVRLTPGEQEKLGPAHAVTPAAYEAYLKGRYFWSRFTPADWQKSIGYFNQAIAADPTYAMGYVGLADAYLQRGSYGGEAPRAFMPKGIAAAQKALELDDSLAAAHFSMAFAKTFYEWDWSGAEREFRRGFDLDPAYPLGHQWYSIYLTAMGRHAEAIAEQERARQLDPLSLIINTNLARAYYFAGDYDRAIEQGNKTLELDRTFPMAHSWLRDSYMAKGMGQQALREAAYGMPPADTARLQQGFATSGLRGVYLWDLHQTLELRRKGFHAAEDIAGRYACVGDKATALRWLEQAYEERDAALTLLNVMREYDLVRSEPRFQDLLRRMNLPVEAR